MKPNETFFKAKKRYVAVMLLCFLYGGFSLIFFLLQGYSFFWESELGDNNFSFDKVPSGLIDDNSFKEFNAVSDFKNGKDVKGFRQPRNPLGLFTSPMTLLSLLGGLISIFAGLTIWSLTREKEIKSIKQQLTDKLLLPDEKKVVDVLKKADYELTQAKLVKETGLSKVQVHRAIKKLELKGALEKHGYGLTNKIILKKEFFE